MSREHLSSVRIHKPIGQGSFGTVYKGQFNTGSVALKLFASAQKATGMGGVTCSFSSLNSDILKMTDTDIDKTETEMLNEVEMLKEVALLEAVTPHPHVIPLVAYGILNDIPCIIMKLAHKTLHQFMKDHQKSSTKHNLSIVTQLATGVRHLHDKGVLHRDLKPSNIVLDDTDGKIHVRLIDFGMAILIVTSGEPLNSHVVTRWYRAPELLMRSNRYGTGVDMWSLGCIVIELLMTAHTRQYRPLIPGGKTAQTRETETAGAYCEIHCEGGQFLTTIERIGYPTEHDATIMLRNSPDELRAIIMDWLKINRPTCATGANTGSLQQELKGMIKKPLVSIALNCLHYDSEKRPNAQDVGNTARLLLAERSSKFSLY